MKISLQQKIQETVKKVKKRQTDRLGNLRYEHKMYMKKKDRLTADYQKGKLDHAYASQSK